MDGSPAFSSRSRTESRSAWRFCICSLPAPRRTVRIPRSSSPSPTIAAPRTKFPQRRIPSMLLIQNGRVLDPASKTDAAMDVLLDGEVIREVKPAGTIAAPQNVEMFDAAGLIVAPGFIDIHAHLREPGQESSETIESGTQAAARGGFTAVCCMPNTKPVNDNASVTRFIVDRAKAHGSVRVWPIGAASVGSKGEAIAEIAAMKEAGSFGPSDR